MAQPFDLPRNIAIVVCDYPLGTETLVLNSIAMLCERGVHVDIIADAGSLGTPMDLPENARVLQPAESFWDKVVRKLLTWKATRYFYPNRHLRRVARLSPYWASFARRLGRVTAGGQYAYVFCISYPALFAYQNRPFAGSVVYYNMELLDNAPDDNNLYLNKPLCRYLEQKALTNVSQVVAMSEDRAKLFREITEYPSESISVLPILPRSGEAVAPGRYFREKFAIPDDIRIVVYSGGIGAWALLHEIIATVPAWPEKHALVIHTWHKDSLLAEYGQRLQRDAEDLPVYFSLENFTRSALLQALSSANVGLAYYEAIDGNFTNILFSSNKMSEYLLAGLPVLCSPFPSLQAAMETYGLGKAAPVAAIPDALREIMDNEQEIQAAILRARENEMRFDPYFAKAFPKI